MQRRYSIIFHPLAKKEFDESIIWYENALSGLGEEFSKDVESVIKVLERQPKLFSIRKGSLREVLVKRFPYVVVYKINQNLVTIMSVFHTSRNPKYKKR
jgi:plasmid stabilization system protein ParE